ncbi:DUF2140 family protein [Bacillus sp. JCM 19041]|uniref:YpmS family protein n=1 Tax=Bacillus sp. JCM 19041 TaxID=1460637 RepID=UPI000A982D4A
MDQTKRSGRQKRFYKIGFFIVSGLLLALLSVLMIGALRLFANVDQGQMPSGNNENNSAELLSFQLSREQTNTLLTDLLKEEEDMPFQFQLEEDGVYLTGELDLFVSSVDLSMSFNPEVREDGSLLLKAENLSAGTALISAEYALRMFAQFSDLPGWVQLYPDEEAVLIELREFEEIAPYGLRFHSVNLMEDHIELSLIRKEDATAN